jgi:type VI secretion system protein VasG
LKGAPPGYVGYGEGGVLTEAVRRRPYSVVLLDEIEKAHPDVHEIFYQVFDKGWMADGEGKFIDFKNTVILLTSNTGSELISTLCDDPETAPAADVLAAALQPELRKIFPAAFLGRLAVVPYLPLNEASLSRIVRLHLEKIVVRMQKQHNITLEISGAALAHIADQCGSSESGARLLVSFIEQRILPKLSRIWFASLEENRGKQRSLTRIHLNFDPHQAEEGIRYDTRYD